MRNILSLMFIIEEFGIIKTGIIELNWIKIKKSKY